MISTTDSSPSDIQELYRTHVHENRILKGNMRDLEKQTVKTLKNLSVESRQFKNKFSKYLKGRRRNSIHDLPLSLKSSVDNETNRPMSRDMVCNECPYSFKTWNNLIDTNKDGIDCYKSEILFGDSKNKKSASEAREKEHFQKDQLAPSGMVTEIPGFKRNLDDACRLSVSASVLVGRSGRGGNSPGNSPRSERSRETADLQKFSTSSRKTHEATITDCITLKIDHSKTTQVPTIKVASVEDIHSSSYANNGKTGVDEFEPYEEEFHRGRSHTIDNNVKPVLLKRRKRIENQVNDNSAHHSSFASVTLKVMADNAKGFNKFKYLSKLVQELPLTDYEKILGENNSKEKNSLPDIFESVKNCRYLRSPPTSRRGSTVELSDEERYKWS